MIELSIVIPCFNEARGLEKLTERCLDLVTDERVEVILVNNGSTDSSKEVFYNISSKKYARLKIADVPVNKGYGHGILQGLSFAEGRYIGWTHADLQTDPLDVREAMELIESSEKGIFVKGKRYGRPATDVLFTMGMSIYESILLRAPLWDINAQPTIFPKEFFDTWVDAPDDFSLDLYAYFKAKKADLLVKRFRVRFGEREFGISSWNVDWDSKRKFIKRTIQFSRELKKRTE